MTNPALILPWLAAVNRHYLPVAGIYLVSMLTAALVRKTGHDLTRLLVVAPHGPGLRLTFFKDGELCVSRLSRGSKGSAAARDAGAIAAEISSTRAYLAMLQLDSPDDTLKVLFVDSDDGLAGMVESVASESANLQCVRVSRADLIRQLQMAPEHLDVALETAYLKLMAEQAPAAANLASVAITAKHRQIQRSNAVYAAGAALGLAGLAWSGFNLWQAHDIAETTAGDAKRTAAAQTQYRDLAREFPAIPTTTDNLINTVENYKKLSRAVRSPQPFMQIVSRAVEPSREVFLQEINWVYRSDTPNASGSTTGSTAGSSAGGARPAQPGAAPEAAGDARQTGYVSGEIRPFAGDYRAAIDAINLIAKRLARDPAVAEAQVVKYPLNVNPGLSLSGNTKESSEPSGAAEFKITLTLKPDA